MVFRPTRNANPFSQPFALGNPGGNLLVYDTFTGVNNTLLTAHAAETGGTWSITIFSDSGKITSNKAVIGAGFALNLQSTIAADVTIETDLTYVTSTFFCGFLCRFSGTSGWRVHYSSLGPGWQWGRYDAGVFSNVGSVASFTMTNGVTYHLKLVLSGSSFAFYVDGVLVLSRTDSTYQAQTSHGLLFVLGSPTYDEFLITA